MTGVFVMRPVPYRAGSVKVTGQPKPENVKKIAKIESPAVDGGRARQYIPANESMWSIGVGDLVRQT